MLSIYLQNPKYRIIEEQPALSSSSIYYKSPFQNYPIQTCFYLNCLFFAFLLLTTQNQKSQYSLSGDLSIYSLARLQFFVALTIY